MQYLPASSEEARLVLQEMREGMTRIAVLTVVVGLFPVALTLYLLLVFDVALPGHSGPTLMGVTALFLLVAGFIGFITLLRGRMLGQLGEIAAAHMTPRMDDVVARMSERESGRAGAGSQLPQDLDTVQGFFRGNGLAAWLDLAPLPILLFASLFLGPSVTLVMLLTIASLAALLFLGLRAQQRPARERTNMIAGRDAISQTSTTYSATIRALGMRGRAMQAWQHANDMLANAQRGTQEHLRRIQIGMQTVRLAGFAVLLAAGGALAIADRASAGVVFAAALLGWFAFAPLVRLADLIQPSVAALQAWERLDRAFAEAESDPPTLELPPPSSTLSCDNMAVMVPGARRPTVQGIRFTVTAGDVVTVLGPGGSGKSTLLQGLAGARPLVAGKVRLDGAALDQWDDSLLGRHIGYMPQTLDLIDGTVAENIARFEPDSDPRAIVEAAQAAQAHDMIVRLPDGYNTRVGPNGSRLSLSEVQRVALARALYGNPFLVILDEPTAHLDGRSEKAVISVVAAARDRGAIVIMGGAAASLIDISSHVLVIRDGMMIDFGDKQEVRQRMAARYSNQPGRSVETGSQPGSDKSLDMRAEEDTPA